MIKSSRWVVVLVLFGFPVVSWAQSDWKACEAPHDGLLQSGPLDYHVVEPPNVQSDTPVVVMIHGLGHDKDGFEGFVRGFQLPYRLVLPNAPRRYKKGFSWYRVRCDGSVADVKDSTNRLLALFRVLKKRWPRAGNPYVLGFSQGGVMGMSLAAHQPTQVAGVVALSGYLVPLDLRIRKRKGPTPPLWIAHGRKDTVVRFHEGATAARRFKSAGYAVTFVPHEWYHAVPPAVVKGAGEWIKDQVSKRKGAFAH